MAPDATTPPEHESRRKTLEDIRREIAVEFAVPGDPDLDEEQAVEAPRPATVERAVHAPVRARRWREYVMAGAIGCIIGQLVILASFVVTRYRDEIIGPRTVVSGPRLSAPVLRADETVVLPAPLSPSASPPEAAAPALDAAPDQPPAVAPIAPPVPRVAAEQGGPEPPPRVVVRQLPSVTPPQLRPPLAGPIDWAESQASLRIALRDWVILWSRADVQAHLAEAEVILGADGWTAKTRVPMTSRAGAVIREQRWELGAKGWTLVDDRELERRAH